MVCVPGGPGQAFEYLGELGGLSDRRALILLDNRGSGALTLPVLLVAGEYDIWPTCAAVGELAALLHNAELAVLPRAGHSPRVDDHDAFADTVDGFLART